MTRTSTSIEAQIAEGVVALAAAVGIGQTATWSHKRMPDTPDRCVTVTAYRTRRHPVARLDGYAVQLYGRGVADDELDVDELMGPIADWFAELEQVDLPGAAPGHDPVHIDQVSFRSSAPMGTDTGNRTERADTFDLDITPPATPRRQT